jgi:hypothetical protein
MEPVELPTRESSGGDQGATQLSILLSSVTAMIDEEFKRSERLDAKARNQITIAGTFFAVVQAVVVGLINGSLGATETHGRSSWVWVLSIAGVIGGISVVGALYYSYRAWQLQDDSVLEAETITEYVNQAREGNPAVGVNLIKAFSTILEDRRGKNRLRAESVESAAKACAFALAFVSIELILSFLAVAIQ